MSDIIKLRTEVVLSCIKGLEPPVMEYLEALNGSAITKQDMAALSMMSSPPPYSMKDLGKPLPVAEMVLPPDYQSYLAGHTKLSTSYLSDWPIANSNNRFGEHHPFNPKSNSNPLLHGGSWGEPHYIDHVFDFVRQEENEELTKASGAAKFLDDTPAHRHQKGERTKKLPLDSAKVFGNPRTSILSLYEKDVGRFNTFEEWEEAKKEQLEGNYGLLPYLLGMEWNTNEHNEKTIDLLKNLAKTEDIDHPNAKVILNSLQGKAGITWDRLLRSWHDRFTPLKSWWMRPSDKHGPTTSPMSIEPHSHLIHPFIDDEEAHNYHWWEPFQTWGGVGRSEESLHSIFAQSYPEIFNSWLGQMLLNNTKIDGRHMLAGSHFPEMARNEPENEHIHSSLSTGDLSFERRRSNWSHAANHHHLHPNQIMGQGGRMTIPPEAFSVSQLGRALQRTTDVGVARQGLFREEHPNSNRGFYDLHNQHFTGSDNALAEKMKEMSLPLMQKYGAGVFGTMGLGDKTANTIARGNVQQLAAAANYALMQGNGRVHPSSNMINPPVFNTGNTDAWGHNMTATLAWKPNKGNPIFDLKQEPFSVLQRTAHEGLVRGVDSHFDRSPIQAKTREIHALSPGISGFPGLTSDLHKSDDDYEPTGVFQSLIEPAHVIRDLDDLDMLKGFSGDWIVQKKPAGEHVLVKKKGKSVEPGSLHSKVKKSLKDSINGDAILDAYIEGDVLTVVDLLVHKGTDMSVEPLSDRVNTLRTLYETTENVHYPSPSSCVNTDEDGLIKTIASMDDGDLLIRDATSTFMKGNEIHPKWVLYPKDDITKSRILPPLPEISIRGSEVILQYPTIYDPVIVKTAKDEEGVYVDAYEGKSYLVKQAQSQFPLWSPVAALFVNEGDMLFHLDSYSPYPIKKASMDKAPEVMTDEEEEEKASISTIMRHARRAITGGEESMKEKKLLSHVEGLTPKILELYAGEYGLEQTETGEWTVNEAIDDDIAEKFAFPRMNRASGDGGAWSGMQGDITAPTGPTEITDEENTTFGDPKQDEKPQVTMEDMFKPLSMVVTTDDGDAVLEVKEGKAILRYPGKEKDHAERENDVLPALRDDKAL